MSKELTPVMSRTVRECADDPKCTLQAAIAQVQKLGYRGNKKAVEAAFNERRDRIGHARESGALLVAALKLEDETIDLINDLLEYTYKVELDNPRDIRDLLSASSRVPNAFRSERGGPELMERAMNDLIDLLEGQPECPDFRSRVEVLFPKAAPEPEDEPTDEPT